MRGVFKELQRFAGRARGWWVAGLLLVAVVVLLGVMVLDDDGRTLAERVADGGFASGALAFVMPAAIAGIVLVAGASGELRAMLAVEPRREVVYRTKVSAAALVVVPAVAAAYLLYAGGAWGVHAAAGMPADGAGPDTAGLAAELAWTGLRVLALAAAAGALGGALGTMIGRWPVATLVLCIALATIERVCRGLDAPEWSLTMNARAWLAGPHAVALTPGGAGPWWMGGLVVLGVVAVAVVVGSLVFRRRELR
ncbi:hypothetical protein [Myceligenerans crystallogenes]|uniref:ABC-2 family transporter protein n=1 Tax=Myceligenerans crystallogenes TaxID=316335 RepID=A0ABN2NLQ0_9MICO